MELKEVLAISGAPGLFKYVAQGKNGIIVESLTDKRRTMVGGSTKVSALGDIAVFTDTEEIPLGDIFQTIYEQNEGKPVSMPAKPSPEELKAFMEKVLPDYDRDRVHNSDIKKIAQWYNALVAAGMTSFKEAEEEAAEQEAAATDEKKTAPAKKAAASKPKAAPAQKAPKAESRAKAPASRSTTVRKAQ